MENKDYMITLICQAFNRQREIMKFAYCIAIRDFANGGFAAK